MISALSVVGSAIGAAVPVKSPAPAEISGAGFGAMLGEVSTGAIEKLKAGEAAAISGIQGKASVQQVVEAVMNAEESLHTVIAIRDKAVAAYQTLTQMAI